MSIRLTALLAPILIAPVASATPPKDVGLASFQFTLYHFKYDRVRISVNGKLVFDRALTTAADNARSGLSAVAQIGLPACADILLTTKRQKVARRLCVNASTKSIVIDAGPPLTILAKTQYQGID